MKRIRYTAWRLCGLTLMLATTLLLNDSSLNLAYIALIKNPSATSLAYPSATAHQAEIQGRLALLNGKTNEAIAYLSHAIALGRSNEVTHFQLGEAYARAGDLQSAIGQWRSARAASYFFQRGLTLRHQQDWPGAEATLRLAEQIDPADPNIQNFLAQFYLEWGKREEAQAHLRAALKIETRAYEQLLLQGAIAQLERRGTDAESFFRAALRQQPTRPEAYRRLAETLAAQDKRANAISVLHIGLQRATPALDLYLLLAQWLTEQSDFAAADRLYERAQFIDPQSDEPWLLRAQNALAWNHATDAEYYLQRALQLEPHNAETLRWLATVKARQSQ